MAFYAWELPESRPNYIYVFLIVLALFSVGFAVCRAAECINRKKVIVTPKDDDDVNCTAPPSIAVVENGRPPAYGAPVENGCRLEDFQRHYA